MLFCFRLNHLLINNRVLLELLETIDCETLLALFPIEGLEFH